MRRLAGHGQDGTQDLGHLGVQLEVEPQNVEVAGEQGNNGQVCEFGREPHTTCGVLAVYQCSLLQTGSWVSPAGPIAREHELV